MDQGIKYPTRYNRNFQTLSHQDQEKLAGSTVAVIGCGGLGGFMAEELARLGIGRLILIDGDQHEETNLNRQLTSTEQTLGQWKVHAAQVRLQQVNSNVFVQPHAEFFTRENAGSILAGADLVMDALDSIPARLTLEQCCHELGLTLVFAAIGGWYGMLGVSYPGDHHLASLYGNAQKRGVESVLGNPAFTPAVAASLAVAEALKLLIGKPVALRKSWLHIDLLNMEFEHFYYHR